jgi:hypothetical protein
MDPSDLARCHASDRVDYIGEFNLPAPLVERRDCQGGQCKMIGQKDKAFAGFRIDKTDAAQMLWIILPAVEAVKRDGLIEAQACRLVDGATAVRFVEGHFAS